MDMNDPDPDIRCRLEEAALLGELTRPLIHQVNNYLNTLLLQIALMDARGPEPANANLASLRQEARNLATLIQSWQRKRQAHAESSRPCDLNQLILDSVRNSQRTLGAASQIDLDLATGPLLVKGSWLDWRHLCVLLTKGVLASRQSLGLDEGSVLIQTQRQQQNVVLRVCDRGPGLSENALTELFDAGRNLSSGLEFAACKNLAHRLVGKLQAINHPQDGLAISFVTLAADL